MTKAGERLIAPAQEARQIAAGEIPAARIWHNGHVYVPVSEIERLTAENERLRALVQLAIDAATEDDCCVACYEIERRQAEHLSLNQQQPPQAWVEAKKEVDDGWPDR